jgi:hypothetical protein
LLKKKILVKKSFWDYSYMGKGRKSPMFRTTSTKGKTYEYDYCRLVIDRKVWAEMLAVCQETGQKPKVALEAAVRQWLQKQAR